MKHHAVCAGRAQHSAARCVFSLGSLMGENGDLVCVKTRYHNRFNIALEGNGAVQLN